MGKKTPILRLYSLWTVPKLFLGIKKSVTRKLFTSEDEVAVTFGSPKGANLEVILVIFGSFDSFLD